MSCSRINTRGRRHKGCWLALVVSFMILAMLIGKTGVTAQPRTKSTEGNSAFGPQGTTIIDRGAYLARIGVCAACHTPPAIPVASSKDPAESEKQLRTNPDWYAYLDHRKEMSGGVPFIVRLSGQSSGLVVSSNLTPDPVTGLGAWSIPEIVRAIKWGIRKDGTALFLFPPHTFYRNLADEDAVALATYLKSLNPVQHAITKRNLPDPPKPNKEVADLKRAPIGRIPARAAYLLNSLVACKECHAHARADGSHAEYVGGKPGSGPFAGVFRLGPDLPLRQDEKGFAAFPYPGYAALYAGNLTRFGSGGDLAGVPVARIVDAMRRGIAVIPDQYGRPRPLAHVMMWQFYRDMSDDDAYSIAAWIKTLKYEQGYTGLNLVFFGENWEGLFRHVYNEPPTDVDRKAFGKN